MRCGRKEIIRERGAPDATLAGSDMVDCKAVEEILA